MSPNEPLPIFRPSLYLPPTLSSIIVYCGRSLAPPACSWLSWIDEQDGSRYNIKRRPPLDALFRYVPRVGLTEIKQEATKRKKRERPKPLPSEQSKRLLVVRRLFCLLFVVDRKPKARSRGEKRDPWTSPIWPSSPKRHVINNVPGNGAVRYYF